MTPSALFASSFPPFLTPLTLTWSLMVPASPMDPLPRLSLHMSGFFAVVAVGGETEEGLRHPFSYMSRFKVYRGTSQSRRSSSHRPGSLSSKTKNCKLK